MQARGTGNESELSVYGYRSTESVAGWRPLGWTAEDETRATDRDEADRRRYWVRISEFLALPADVQTAYLSERKRWLRENGMLERQVIIDRIAATPFVPIVRRAER